MSDRPHYLHRFSPPYRLLTPIAHPDRLTPEDGLQSTAIVWAMGQHFDEGLLRALRWRPGGVSLVVIAPPAREVEDESDLLRVLELCRPVALLPFHEEPSVMDLRVLLREPPEPLPGQVVDYFAWRGLVLDLDLRRLLRRVIELSAELRTVAGLSRGVYMSRRALGRHFLTEGLPVPSHWLHFSRLLRAVLQMQRGDANLVNIAFRLGYPDAFALSNQMKRLTGVRPSEARGRLGWEWFVEAWIQEEIRSGGFGEGSVELLHSRGTAVRPIEADVSDGGAQSPPPAAGGLRPAGTDG